VDVSADLDGSVTTLEASAPASESADATRDASTPSAPDAATKAKKPPLH
jgi:hypothetical protein